jgi:hypothetical protein
MYNIDPDLKKHFNKEDLKKNKRTPKFPHTDGNFECLLKRVKKNETDGAGRLYEFKFSVTKSTTDLVMTNKEYTLAYFPKASKREIEMFWRNVTPLLMAIKGETEVDEFEPCEVLAELEGICNDSEDLELDLPFRMSCRLEPAKKDKQTGKYNPKHVNEDGTPKIFRQDEFSPSAA